MNKKQLRETLRTIQDKYEVAHENGKDLLRRSDIECYVKCLNHPNLRAYLLKSEIAPDEEEADEMLEDYSMAEGIILEFQEGLGVIESIGLIRKKQGLKQSNWLAKNQVNAA